MMPCDLAKSELEAMEFDFEKLRCLAAAAASAAVESAAARVGVDATPCQLATSEAFLLRTASSAASEAVGALVSGESSAPTAEGKGRETNSSLAEASAAAPLTRSRAALVQRSAGVFSELVFKARQREPSLAQTLKEAEFEAGVENFNFSKMPATAADALKAAGAGAAAAALASADLRFYPRVLQWNCWLEGNQEETRTEAVLNWLPPVLAIPLRAFQVFYAARYSNRRLSWQLGVSRVTLCTKLFAESRISERMTSSPLCDSAPDDRASVPTTAGDFGCLSGERMTHCLEEAQREGGGEEAPPKSRVCLETSPYAAALLLLFNE